MFKNNYSSKNLDWKILKDIDVDDETTCFFLSMIIILIGANFLVFL